MSFSLPPNATDSDKYAQLNSGNERELLAESSLKSGDKPGDTLHVKRGAIRVPSPDPSLVSIDDSSNIRLGRNLNHVPFQEDRNQTSQPLAAPQTLKERIQASWITNKGLALVLVAQFFGTLMNVTTRMLEMEGNDGENTQTGYFRQS